MLVLVVLVAARSCGGPVLYVEHTEACALFHRIENVVVEAVVILVCSLYSSAGHDAHCISDSAGWCQTSPEKAD